MLSSIRNHSRSLFTLVSALFIAAGASGCNETLEPEIDLVDATKQPLEIGQLLSINGTYGANCTSRSGSWSLAVENGATLANPALSVVKNDSACVLTLTEIVADQTYEATPDIGLGAAYQGSASAFAAGANPAAFYANAKMNPADFSAAFTLTILYSDDPAAASGSNNASYASWSASAAGDQVTAPDYAHTDNLGVSVDANDAVTAAAGSADFTDGSVIAEHYMIDMGALPASPTYADLLSAWAGGTPTAISGADPSIAASAFDLVGDTLPQVRTVIFRHVENNVASFQTFKVTFNAP